MKNTNHRFEDHPKKTHEASGISKFRESLIADYVDGITKICTPNLIIGYGSFFGDEGISLQDRDFDVLTIVDNYESDLLEQIARFTREFHTQHGLSLDWDVPYNCKTLYSESELLDAFSLYPFPYDVGEFFIAKITFDPAFLSSYAMKLRLLMNACTCKNRALLVGKYDKYEDLTKKCIMSLIVLILGHEHYHKDAIIERLITDLYSGNTGSAYLGYTERDTDTLGEAIASSFEDMQLLGQAHIDHEGRYFLDADFLAEYIEKQRKLFFYQKNESDHSSFSSVRVLDFSQNTNPLGPPKSVHTSGENILQGIIEYPDYTHARCNQDLARFLGIPQKNVTVCQGSLEAIYMLPQLLELSPLRALNIVPTYWGYAAAIRKLGGSIENYELNQEDFSLDVNRLRSQLQNKNIVYICNPNNPTSTYLSKNHLTQLIEEFPDCHFVIDESHLLLRPDFHIESLSQEVQNYRNISVIYSLSKFFNIPGLRVGALVSNAQIIETYKNTIVPYSLNTLSQALLVSALSDQDFIKKTPRELMRLRNDMEQKLMSISWLRVYPSSCNYFLCKIIDPKISAFHLYETLLQRGFSIRECKTIYRELQGEWIRISVNLSEKNTLLVGAFHDYYNQFILGKISSFST